MKKIVRALILSGVLLLPQATAFGWHDAGHMVVAQIAYLGLSPAAKREVDRLLLVAPDKRALVFYCDKKYDPITIAVWMDDFKSDSLNDNYANWHYINYKPLFDGVPERANVGPEPTNVLDRLNWLINTLRAGVEKDKDEAELLGFLFHLVGDVHQPMHTTTRYSPKNPDGDAGGNGFAVQMPAETRIKNLHSFWDSAGGQFGFDGVTRDAAGATRIRGFADRIMKDFPASAMPERKTLDVQQWVDESNTLARKVAYAKIKDGDAPAKSYTDETQKITARRIALAGYRLAEVLNSIYLEQPKPVK
ncbi:MAG TPA: S1/P1 nuclease [Pyrinomonadaceae bacterium]|jgi:hypothetical protein|nr:S1/P1 nuclease [Pyrinomonadaceae bacterium]